jgi:Fe-S-cluster containining protein
VTRSTEAPWYAEGLRFRCTQCGTCCRGPEAGYVEVDGPMIERLADHVGLEVDAFTRRYVRKLWDGRLSLTERKGGDCIFWADGQGCTVYAARPTQCRTFPFWPEVLEGGQEAWDEHAVSCPGMRDPAGDLYERERIERISTGHDQTVAEPRGAAKIKTRKKTSSTRGRPLARAPEPPPGGHEHDA